mmetsp:Transcript_18418/g.28689  ORF Transcript_18418/g.28689 Transcript_18418/m.28689 type:complete len:97 (-) Transcript_18418:58-348(-)
MHHHSGLLSGLNNLSSSNTGTTGDNTGVAAAGMDARWKDNGQPLNHVKCDKTIIYTARSQLLSHATQTGSARMYCVTAFVGVALVYEMPWARCTMI